MQSSATAVKDYINSLPQDRKQAIHEVRKVVLAHLPKGYKEIMQYGMISYVVPLTIYPAGYLDKKDVPLPYAALASQKNYMALYLMGLYGKEDSEWFKNEYRLSGQKLDMGKSCLRFKKLEDLNLQAISQAIARISVQKHISNYENSRANIKD